MPWNNYFELRWGWANNAWGYTRQFHMQMGGQHLGELDWTTVTRSLDADAIRVQSPAVKRVIEGPIPFYTTAAIQPPWGTLAEFKTALRSSDLQCKGYTDTEFWNAVWLPQGQLQPEHWDPHGYVMFVTVHLEER